MASTSCLARLLGTPAPKPGRVVGVTSLTMLFLAASAQSCRAASQWLEGAGPVPSTPCIWAMRCPGPPPVAQAHPQHATKQVMAASGRHWGDRDELIGRARCWGVGGKRGLPWSAQHPLFFFHRCSTSGVGAYGCDPV